MSPRILNIDQECTGCSACVSICANKAITIGYNDESFYRPQVNSDVCVNCGLCEKVCPVLSKEEKKPSFDFTSYMIKANDPMLVRKSSSGGAFSLLADIVLKEDGVVFGARYNYDKERLEHCSTDECSIDELRKSKYIESYIGDTYIKIRKNLKEGRPVLFCGTPCQNAGLVSYLKTSRTDTKNLITIEFLCHGVPSNKFFTEYKHYVEKKYGAKLTYVNFRPKNLGWREPNFQLTFSNGKRIDISYKQSYYYINFQHNTDLNRACYTCTRISEGNADFTIGDFWGLKDYKPVINEQEGVSVVMARSEKAMDFIKKIKDCAIEEVPASSVEYAFLNRRSAPKYMQSRKIFMSDVKKYGYMRTAKKHNRKEIYIYTLKTRVKSLLRKLGLWERK